MSRGRAQHLLAVAFATDMTMLRVVDVLTAADGLEAGSVHVRHVPKLQLRAMLHSAATYSAIASVGA